MRGRRRSEELTEQGLKKAFQTAKGCIGPDGWKVGELKAAKPLWSQLAEVYNKMEGAAVLPGILRGGDVSRIPKSDGVISFRNLRPICVLPQQWRIYASARLRATGLPWQEKSMGEELLGGARPGWSAMKITMLAELKTEEARWGNGKIYGANWDVTKAFDSLPYANSNDVFSKMADRTGMPRKMRGMMMQLYERLIRRYKIRQSLGKPAPFGPLRGVPQGCPICLLVMNLMTISWAKWQKNGVRRNVLVLHNALEPHMGEAEARKVAVLVQRPANANTHAAGYLGDMHVISEEREEVQRAHGIVLLWAAAIGVELSPSKSNAWGDVDLFIGRKAVPKGETMNILGDEIMVATQQIGKKMESRLQECHRRIQRVTAIPGDCKWRAKLLVQCAMPTAKTRGNERS